MKTILQLTLAFALLLPAMAENNVPLTIGSTSKTLKFPTQAEAQNAIGSGTKGANIASAATITPGSVSGSFHDITGTTAISSLGTAAAGTRETLRAVSSGLVFTHNATSLINLKGVNQTMLAGDIIEYVSLGSGNWLCTNMAFTTVAQERSYLQIGVSDIVQYQGLMVDYLQFKSNQGADTDTLIVYSGEALTGDRELDIRVGDVNRRFDVLGDSKINQDVQTTASPSFASLTLTSSPKFSVCRTSDISVVTGTFTKVVFDTEFIDVGNNFATGTFTAPVTGNYHFSACISWTSVASERYLVSLFKNGAEVIRGQDDFAPATVCSRTLDCLIPLTSGNTIEVHVYHGGGANRTVNGTAILTYFSGVRIP